MIFIHNQKAKWIASKPLQQDKRFDLSPAGGQRALTLLRKEGVLTINYQNYPKARDLMELHAVKDIEWELAGILGNLPVTFFEVFENNLRRIKFVFDHAHLEKATCVQVEHQHTPKKKQYVVRFGRDTIQVAPPGVMNWIIYVALAQAILDTQPVICTEVDPDIFLIDKPFTPIYSMTQPFGLLTNLAIHDDFDTFSQFNTMYQHVGLTNLLNMEFNQHAVQQVNYIINAITNNSHRISGADKEYP